MTSVDCFGMAKLNYSKKGAKQGGQKTTGGQVSRMPGFRFCFCPFWAATCCK